MDAKKQATYADTYVFDDDVLDEMENFDATQVLDESADALSSTMTQENKFLEDVEDGTVELGQPAGLKKA
jgi:hypothetical protein